MNPQADSAAGRDPEEVFASWVDGRMSADELAQRVGDVPDYDLVGDRLIGALGLPDIDYYVNAEDVTDHAVVRRWAYTDKWSLESQDEDLFVCDFPLVSLVRLASMPDCPKADYIAAAAEDQMRKRVNDAALGRSKGLEETIADMRGELSPLGDLNRWPAATYLIRVQVAIQRQPADLHDVIVLASVMGRCCYRDPSKFEIEALNDGYYVTNIDGHHSALAVARDGRWILAKGRTQQGPPEDWWRPPADRGHSLEM